jgi:hypothetical protein
MVRHPERWLWGNIVHWLVLSSLVAPMHIRTAIEIAPDFTGTGSFSDRSSFNERKTGLGGGSVFEDGATRKLSLTAKNANYAKAGNEGEGDE